VGDFPLGFEKQRKLRSAVNRRAAGASGSLPSPERLSQIIGSIYDCALDPAKWEAVLWDICREFEFGRSILGIVRFPIGAPSIQVSVGVEPEWLNRIAQYNEDIVAIWGGVERIQQFPLDEPVIASQVVGRAAMRENRYFREWAGPQGVDDAVAIALARDASMVGNVAFSRHEPGEIGAMEVEGLRLLAPHIRRAVTISDLFDLKSIETATLMSVIDGLAHGIVVVDRDLAIIHANAMAQAMLAGRDPIRSEKGKVVLAMPASQGALERAVAQAGANGAGLGTKGIGIPARRAEGEPCVVHVLPLERSDIRPRFGPRAAAALFVAPATALPSLPSGAVALLYDLTPAETRIFELISGGKTQIEIGQTLGIAPSTVKTHTLRLFEKTGSKRQADLIRLAARLASPA